MTKTLKKPVTLQEAIVYFSDADRVFEYARELRWPDDNVICPRCGHDKHSFLSTRKIWFCKGCKKQFTIKVGTIFEDSPLGMDKWMAAFWMIVNAKNGVSSYEIHRALGVTQKSAWFMLHRIRLAMQKGNIQKLGGTGGPVEVDETYVGGEGKNKHGGGSYVLKESANWYGKRRVFVKGERKTGRGTEKTAVFGMLDRGTREVRAEVVHNVNRETLTNAILENVQRGSKIYSDAFQAYKSLPSDYIHKAVNHVKEYVRGDVHTNGLENFWNLLKRTLRGTYVAVEPFHLDGYLDEQIFRFNNRATKDNPLTDADRFTLAMSQVMGKRLTYAALTGKGQGAD
jgi:transposase-like protein